MEIIVAYIFIILSIAFIKNVNAYDSFQQGIKSNYNVLLSIFPNMMALILVVEMFRESGILDLITYFIGNYKISSLIFLQMLLKPLSSSSGIILMTNVFNAYGVDSFNGKLSSIIQGSSDTTLYIITLYFSSIKMRKTKYAIAVGLLTDFLTFIIITFIYLKFFSS